MNYDSDSDRSNSIVGFKKSQNKTGTDYRTNFALDAAHLLALRTLCNHVSDDEFTETVTILLLGVAQLLDDAKRETHDTPPTDYPLDYYDSSISSDSEIPYLQSLFDSDKSYDNLSVISSIYLIPNPKSHPA